MDNQTLPQQSQAQQPSSQQQQQQQPSSAIPTPTSTTSRNNKNLSIKEFFTTRLMRTRSFEGGNGSPKDETTNWFDEFKARMIKKSQANSGRQQQEKQQTTGTNTSGGGGNNDETNDESTMDTSETVAAKIATQPKPKHKHHHHHHHKGDNGDQQTTSLVKDTCDTTHLSKLNELSSSDLGEFSIDHSSQSSDPSANTTTSTSAAGLRARKLQRISCVDKPDFDTASINTIFNRRDSRYDTISRKRRRRYRVLLQNILDFIKGIISYLLPFNYNLPWKLLTIINFTFVITIIGLTNATNPDFKTFGFFYGFISGLGVATICAVIVLLSLIVQVLPKSREEEPTTRTVDSSANTSENLSSFERPKTPNLSSIDGKSINSQDITSEQVDTSKIDDFSLFEILEGGNRQQIGSDSESGVRLENPLDDDDYKGWMIEFIGDYELRNKTDIKLKLIYVKVENRILYLCKPKNSDAESATFPVFVQKRIYDLNTAKKFTANLLLPKNVRNKQKWVWSKKYPIKLEFLDDNSDQASKQIEANVKTIQLTLFAKSCREKEEWFRRFKSIVEENKIAQGSINHKRASFQSDFSAGNEDYLLSPSGSKNLSRRRSPSPVSRCDSVQTSQSSHVLGPSKKSMDDEDKNSESGSNLVRTKSCDLFPSDENPIITTTTSAATTNLFDQDQADDEAAIRFVTSAAADDSTLTRETAEMFSQAMEYSNFMESRPNLCYREYIERVIESSKDATSTSDWFNSLTGRIFFDVFSHNYWSVWFKRKIQRKLYRIRLPYFMETLTLTKIDLGTNAPQFLNVVSHSFDSFGLSIDFDMAYSGGLTLTFETKLNLLKIKSDNSNQTASFNSVNPSACVNNNQNPISSQQQQQQQQQQSDTSTKDSSSVSDSGSDNFSGKYGINNNSSSAKQSASSSGSARTSGESSDSDESDSDSSSDSSYDEDDVDEISDWEDYGAEKTRQSIVRFVDKIASSRYFQQATENRYIKKKLQDISNCPLVLVVQIVSLNGVLTLNVPPPQTDRVWYGFKPNPELTLKALPKMGDREVNLSHVTDWIEKKLAEEFRKILVIPNMEDIVLPILKSDHLLYVTSTK